MLEAVIYGAVQGLAEFLPVSSSAHLILVSWLLNGKALPMALNVALHFGTCLAVILAFLPRWLSLSVALKRRIFNAEKSHASSVLLPALFFGTIPAAVLGLLARDKIHALFHTPSAIIVPLIAVGIVLWVVDARTTGQKDLSLLRLRDGLWIGLYQATALIPGVSRSGASIIGARLLGLSREGAVEFSFLLGTPVLLGATLLNAPEMLNYVSDPIFFVGTGVSFAVGLFAIRFFLRFVTTHGLLGFAIYRVLLGIGIALLLR